MKELTHKGRSWRGQPLLIRTVNFFGWVVTQVRQPNGEWRNVKALRVTG